MRWECCECGACVDEARPPSVCPSCGIAGGVLMLGGPDPDDVEAGSFDWMRLGLEAERPQDARWQP